MNWIKTSERLPDFGKEVICYFTNAHDGDSAFIGKLGTTKHARAIGWLDQVGDLYCTLGEVKFWCEKPLPEEQGK